MNKGFLQTEEWLNFQKSVGNKGWHFDNGKITANIIKLGLPLGKSLLYIPHGPEINFNNVSSLKNEVAQFVAYLKKLAKEEKSIFIKAEPLDGKVPDLLHDFGFKKSSKEIQAHKSVVLDLARTEEELLAGMHHKTRYNIKVAEKHGIIVKQSSDMSKFLSLLGKTAKRQRFSGHPKDYYKKEFDFFNKEGEINTELFLAEFEGKSVAGGLMLIHGETYYYLHGGSDHEYRNLMAPFALHWYLIKQANARGFKLYDFGGSETIKWPGITRFKLGWGGRQIEYPGAFDMPIRKLWFFVYKIVRKIF